MHILIYLYNILKTVHQMSTMQAEPEMKKYISIISVID